MNKGGEMLTKKYLSILLTILSMLFSCSLAIGQTQPCPLVTTNEGILSISTLDTTVPISVRVSNEGTTLRLVLAATALRGATASTITSFSPGYYSWQRVFAPSTRVSEKEFIGGELYALVGFTYPTDGTPTLFVVTQPQANIQGPGAFTGVWEQFSVTVVKLSNSGALQGGVTCYTETNYPGARTSIGAEWFDLVRKIVTASEGVERIRSKSPDSSTISGCDGALPANCDFPSMTGSFPFRPQDVLHPSLLDETSAYQLFDGLQRFLPLTLKTNRSRGFSDYYRRALKIGGNFLSGGINRYIRASIVLPEGWEEKKRARMRALFLRGARSGEDHEKIYRSLQRLLKEMAQIT